ncbi:MAG: hypothetical protein ACREX9_18305 [Gammaproteobacteria bacterium]
MIRNDRNVGYAIGTNQSLRACSGEYYVFLLNNDVILLSGILRGLHEYMAQHTKIGVRAPKLLYPAGRLQRSVRGPPTVSGLFHSLFLLDGIGDVLTMGTVGGLIMKDSCTFRNRRRPVLMPWRDSRWTGGHNDPYPIAPCRKGKRASLKPQSDVCRTPRATMLA